MAVGAAGPIGKKGRRKLAAVLYHLGVSLSTVPLDPVSRLGAFTATCLVTDLLENGGADHAGYVQLIRKLTPVLPGEASASWD